MLLAPRGERAVHRGGRTPYGIGELVPVGGPLGNGAAPSPATAGRYGLWSQTFPAGTVIYLDPAPANRLYAAIGAGNLRAYVQGADDVGHQGYRTNGRTVGGWLAGDGMMAIWNIRSVADADCWLREAFQIEPTVWRRFVIRG